MFDNPALLEMLEGLDRVYYRTDELGAFKSYESPERFIDGMNAVFDLVIQEITEDNEAVTPLALRQKMQPVIDLYTSEAGIVGALLQETSPLHWPYGIEIDSRDTVRVEVVFANNYGGPNFPSEGILFVEYTEWADDYLIFRYLQEMETLTGEPVKDFALLGAPYLADLPNADTMLRQGTLDKARIVGSGFIAIQAFRLR